MRWTWMAVLAFCAGCDGIELDQLVEQHAPLTRIAPEPAGAHCAHGGRAVLTGLDLNDDGVLADAEVRGTEYVCDSAPPAALARTREEPAGANCLHGGRAVETGVDADASGGLDDGEVTATEYLCATALPDVLLRTQSVPPGEQCPLGGQVSRAGTDANGNGELEDGEVTREVYGCTQTDPVVTRLAEAPSHLSPCFPAGTLVEAGLDLDRDGALDDRERQASVITCVEPAQVRLRQRPQPASGQCGAGSTRVDMGADVDADGVLEDEEVASTAFICQPLRTFDGTYEVRNTADLAALQGIGRVRGSVRVYQTALPEVVLPGLMAVEGLLLVHGNGPLTRVEMTGLRFVEGDVIVTSNANLETLRLGAPVIASTPLWIQGDLRVELNPRLTTLFGLRHAIPRGSIHVRDNPALETPGSFDNVYELLGSIIVRDNDKLVTLPFPNLRTVGGSVSISFNKVLPSLSGTALLSIGGDLEVSRNDALVDLSGMPQLESVGGMLSVVENDGLRSPQGFESLSRVRMLYLGRNPRLETAAGFPLLRSVGHLTVSENPQLASLGAFQLRSADSIFIGHSPLLTDLKGLERLESVGGLSVEFNSGLTTLADLGHVRTLTELAIVENPNLTRLDLHALTRVDTNFTVLDNPKLPTCLATALATRTYSGNLGPPQITGNDSTATCD